MQTITVKNIPDDIHKLLKDVAKFNHRSLNNEIINCLEKYLKIPKIDAASMLRKAQISRSKIKHRFSDSEIHDTKNKGAESQKWDLLANQKQRR
ncbi:FitA-like ribbon-helix-helix domain-containing protein [Candidatus Scalindua japonica]|nr:Arc family DNA-binding protein [Candidatus Scalindua japonica]